MKVLLFNNFYFPWDLGGAERSVETLAQGLLADGHQVIIASLAGSNRDEFESTVNGIKVYYIKDTNWGASPTNQSRTALGRIAWQLFGELNGSFFDSFSAILETETPDVVHTNNLGGVSVGIWQAAHSKSIPIVHTLRGYYLLCAKGTMLSREKPCAKQCFKCKFLTHRRKSFSNQVNTVVGNSAFILKSHVDLDYFNSAKKKTVIYSAYNRIPSYPEEQTSKRITFGFIGRLHPSKGLSQLLDALQHLDDESFSLLIAGDGESSYVRDLKLLSQHSTNITFIGWSSPEEFFPKIDALIVPSLWHDPLPRVVYESYSYGKPVIGSNRGGIPESIIEGQTGWIFEPDDPDQLLSLLRQAIDSPNKLKGMNDACITEAHQFSLERCVEQYTRVYIEAIDAHQK